MIPFIGRARRERELDEEIRTHLEMAIEDRVARGEPRAEAERAVRREFGEIVRVKEVTRRSWGGAWLDRLVQDVRFGVRTLLRNPGFGIPAVLVLTIGIGANTTVFTLSDRLLRSDPPAVTAPEELVAVRWIAEDGTERAWGYPNYEFVRAGADALSGVLAYAGFPLPAAIGRDGVTAQADAWIVSENYFDVLGTPMAKGRGFLPEEGRTPGTHPVAVISHGFWQASFGGAPDIVGREFALNGRTFTVVGVTPPDFRGISPTEVPPALYVPIMMQGVFIPNGEQWLVRRRGEVNNWLRVVGRLAPGVTLEAAQANLAGVQAAWGEEFSSFYDSPMDLPVRMTLSADYRFGMGEGERLGGMLRLLMLVAGCILLIGSANLAILLLARASARESEMGVRAAIGAGRSHLLLQLMTEGLLLALLGVLGGFIVGTGAAVAIATLLPYTLAVDFSPDLRVFAFAGVIGVAVTVLFGLAPALRLARADSADMLRRGRRTTDRGLLRNFLVVAQLAASVVLVLGAGLFVRSMLAANAVDLGFEPEGKTIASVRLANHGYDEARGRIFVDEALRSLRSTPGVDGATVAYLLPLRGFWTTTNFRLRGTVEDDAPVLSSNRVGSSFFDVMGIPIVAGRAITDDDRAETARVLLVNETGAGHLWPGQDPIGKTLLGTGDRPWTVVGVARDGTHLRLGEDTPSHIYLPHSQAYGSEVTFIVASALPAAEIAASIRSRIAELDPNLAIFGVQPLKAVVDEQTAQYRVLAILVSVFGLIALLLAAVGLYGVQSYLVGRRSREIGIRMALGAQGRQVAVAILRGGAGLALVGLLIGTVAGYGLSGFVRSMLFGVRSNDPVAFAIVIGALLATASIASFFPARRASRVDPIVAIRAE
jgi:putative ABC transport system permease protein